ncbi:hypothetical protein VTK73DRAFT_7772 [Phialemonium thermophilum]|uniref:FAD-binding PCMH-type domain-containing protein n=1 Tax=Phialemonium thermophilum TaxID=223376 RepID=A0ABR3XS90_9PEZI
MRPQLGSIGPVVVAICATVHAKRLDQRAAITDCLQTAGVPEDDPGSTDWAYDVAPFNQRFNYTPLAIAVPLAVEHVQAAVSCAVKVGGGGIKVNAKAGGHSYAAFGLGGEDGHLVIELDRMNNVELDPDTNIATIEAGARLGHVALSLFEQGQRAFSHAGHSLHGGFGFSSHTHGLALDWMAGATVVLANGTAVECSENENTDLFWALRGAGSCFGVVTSFRFRTFPAPPVVTVFGAILPWRTAEQAYAGWSVLQDWVLVGGMPAEMNMRVFGVAFGAQLQGLYHGNASAMEAAVAPLLTLLNTTLWQVNETDWMGGFEAYANGDTINATHPYTLQELFYSKSLVTSPLPPEAMHSAVDYWFSAGRNLTSRVWYIIIDMYGGANAAIPQVAATTTSYAHRGDRLFLYEFYDRQVSGKTFPASGFAFLDGFVDAFTRHLDTSQWGMYVNYADPRMSRAEAQEVYWRDSLPRLQQIKARVDPADLFYYPQSVEPAGLEDEDEDEEGHYDDIESW